MSCLFVCFKAKLFPEWQHQNLRKWKKTTSSSDPNTKSQFYAARLEITLITTRNRPVISQGMTAKVSLKRVNIILSGLSAIYTCKSITELPVRLFQPAVLRRDHNTASPPNTPNVIWREWKIICRYFLQRQDISKSLHQQLRSNTTYVSLNLSLRLIHLIIDREGNLNIKIQKVNIYRKS